MATSDDESGIARTVKLAATDLVPRLGFTVFVRGPLRVHAAAMEDLWSRLRQGWLDLRPSRCRAGGNPSWERLSGERPDAEFARLFGMRERPPGCWLVELSDRGDGEAARTVWTFSDVTPVLGMERASHLRVLFADEPPLATLAALGEWAIGHLPLWWASAGFVFHHSRGTMLTAHRRMAALARRYWGVQIQDLACLQWDALRGMPGVNWLTLIGNEFAASHGLSVDALEADAAGRLEENVFHLRGEYGLALAAGAKPLRGDINAGDDLSPYVNVAKLIQPLLLNEHTALFGPFAKTDVLRAWLGRFVDPRAWLECDIESEGTR